MPTELLLAAVGAGKTEYAIRQLMDAVKREPFGQVWVLLPGRRQEDAFRQRLIDHPSGQAVYFNVTFFNFYSLYTRLLDMVGQPQREVDDAARVRLIRQLLTNLRDQNQLQVFHSIADKPGFARIMADFIYELKQNVVRPEDFQDAVRTPKDHDLANIYDAYQAALRDHDLVDREGEGWLALEEVRKNDGVARDVNLLLIDGFDQLNPLQSQLVALLAERVQHTLMTLPVVEGREKTVGRRFSEARTRIETALGQNGQEFTVRALAASPDGTRHHALRHLTTHYNLPNGVTQPDGGDCLTLVEAPEPKQETEAVMRQVKHLLLTGSQPDDVLIAVRDWERYGAHLADVAQRYAIPAVLHYGQPLANNPAMIALLNLLELAQNHFRRRDLLDVLRSLYYIVAGLEREQVDLLDRISQAQHIVSGKTEWLEGIRLAARATTDEYGEKQEAIITSIEAEHLAHGLTTFFEAVTPPAEGTETQYVNWIERLLGPDVEPDPDDDEWSEDQQTYSLQVFKCVRTVVEGRGVVARDLIALQEFTRVLRSLLATQRLFATLNFKVKAETTWQTFLRDLKSSVGSAASNPSPNRSGKVLVTSVADARGLPHKHVIIPGLSEGLFPLPAPEDPLYLDSERQVLTQAGIYLETQAERAADDGLFYELICQAQETLMLTRPTVQNGAPWPESHLWRAVKMVFADAETIIERHRIRLGGVVDAEKAATRSEAALAVAEAFCSGEIAPASATLYNYLLKNERDHWQHIRHGRAIELRRMRGRSFDSYSGWLREPHLVEWVAGELGERRVWSASQFNDYGMCGFRFFAKRLLKLEELKEPDEGMDAQQLGTVNHALLETTYRRLADMQVTITPDYQEQAVAVLQAAAAELLPDAPHRYGFRESALWAQEQKTLLRKLEAIVRLDFSDESPIKVFAKDLPRQPYQQETAFTSADNHVLTLPLDSDNALRVTGYIDRMDRVGDRVIVVDYKTGSTRIPVREMQEGRNFQMMLYLLAGQAILERDTNPDAPQVVAGGVYWHLRNGTISGEIHMDKDDDRAAIEQAKAHLSEHLRRGRAGQFAVQPSQRGGAACSHYCEFSHLCRVSIMNHRRKVD